MLFPFALRFVFKVDLLIDSHKQSAKNGHNKKQKRSSKNRHPIIPASTPHTSRAVWWVSERPEYKEWK